MKKILLFIWILLQISTIQAHQTERNFKHLTVQDGLSHSFILSICQDNYGFLWIGTDDGLDRYDGYSIKNYRLNPKNSNSLPHNSVKKIYEDSQGKLWIGTQGGLTYYDRKMDRFVRHKQWTYGSMTDIIETENGDLLISSPGTGVYKYESKNDSIYLLLDNSTPNKKLTSSHITKLLKDTYGNIWIGTIDGLNVYDRKRHIVIQFMCDKNNPFSISGNDIKSLESDQQGRIWIGTNGNGLNYVKANKNMSGDAKFHRIKYMFSDNTSITKSIIDDLLVDNNNNLWIGIFDDGLNILDLNAFDNNHFVFQRYKHDPHNDKSISDDKISVFYQDNAGSVWVGTTSNGISMYNRLLEKFTHYKHEPNNKYSLSHNSVNTFFDDGDAIWIGTEGGINLFNKEDKTFIHFVHDPQNKKSVGSNAIWAIRRDSRDNLWIGTWAGGLNRFNPKDSSFTKFKHNPDDNTTIGVNNIFSIIEDKQNNLWLGTMGGGLNLFNYENQTFTRYMHSDSDPTTISDDWVRAVFESSYGEIWLALSSKLNRMDPKTGIVTLFLHDTADDKSLSYNGTNVIFEDSKHQLWIGTGNGLNIYDRENNGFLHYFEEDGLPSNSINGILEDDHGNLWISTNKGISQFVNGVEIPEIPTFINFDIGKGLQENEFRRRSCLKSSDGYMYFGGNNGFHVFHPDSLYRNKKEPPVVITDFLLFNKPVAINAKGSPLKENINIVKEIKLSYKHSVFTFEFAALDYIAPENNQYAYMLEGFEKEWNYVGDKRIATYTNLDPGEYTFRVKAANNDGVFNEIGASINLIITPPFWQTWWFRIILILLCILLIITVNYVRTYNIRKTNKQLENKVKERTRELMQSNKELADKKNLLQTLIDIIPDHIYIKDNMCRFILNNKSHLHLLGAKKQEDVIGKTDLDIFPSRLSNSYFEDEQKILMTGKSQINKEEQVVDQTDERQYWVTATKVRFSDSDGEVQGIVGISHDISERKKFEEQLKQAKEIAEVANRSKSDFLANMSHEIRTPMNGVIGMTELALDLATNKQQKNFLKIAKQSAESLLDLLNDILDYSKIEVGKLDLEEIDFVLRDIVEIATATFALRAQNKGLELLCDINHDVPIYLKGDPGRLRQIIINLVGNAIKFTEKGEIIVQVKKIYKKSMNGGQRIGLQFTVSDTGIGIAEDKIDKIFKSFSQEDSSTTRKYGGTGLGLTISQRLSELMGGKIWVTSEKGKGSKFQFTAYFKAGKPVSEIKHEQTEKIDFNNSRVLIVDDNETNCLIMQKVMELWHFKPHICCNGKDALAALYEATVEEESFKLILLDYMMPEMDGFAFAEKVRSNKKWDEIKIIMMSSISKDNKGNFNKKIRIDSYLNKPIRQADLLHTINIALGVMQDPSVASKDDAASKDSMPNLKILLAEDNIINQKVATNLLKKWGHNITIANNGKEALDQLEQIEFDMVLMDIQMPNMDGIEATKKIRNSTSPNINSQIPIIAMTAHTMKGDRERFLAASMDDYISKPINVDEMFKLLKKYATQKLEKI